MVPQATRIWGTNQAGNVDLPCCWYTSLASPLDIMWLS